MTTKITHAQFMEYFRSDDFDNEMSDSDCEEVFLGSLKGQSDITYKLLNQLCSDYDSSLEGRLLDDGFIITAGHPKNELRALVYKGYECNVIHKSAEADLDDQAMYVCDDDEWAMSDDMLISRLVAADVIPETDDELTMAQAVDVVLGYQDTVEGVDWEKAMRAMQEWSENNVVFGL
jgi:hypothetical protein